MKSIYILMIIAQTICWVITGIAFYFSYVVGLQNIIIGSLILLSSIYVLYLTIESTILLYEIIKNGW